MTDTIQEKGIKTVAGVAKSYYKIEDTDFTEPGKTRGSSTDIEIHDEVYGCVLRTMDNVKPVFVSAGNYISLKTSVDIVPGLTDKGSHIPVPAREADLETHRKRDECRMTGVMGACWQMSLFLHGNINSVYRMTEFADTYCGHIWFRIRGKFDERHILYKWSINRKAFFET